MNRIRAVAVKPEAVAAPFAADSLTEAIRIQIRQAIVRIAGEELSACIGAGAYARTESRRGYRNGTKTRTLTTSMGPTRFEMPRAVVFEGGRRVEWRSAIIPRYARRAREVDATLLGLYFGGVNTRKVQVALRPLLRESPLSKSAISRLVGSLKDYFESWQNRSLAGEAVQYLYLDATFVPVRCAGRSRRLPVMVAVGVRPTGEKVLLDLRLLGSESTAAWESFVGDMVARGLKRPVLAITDGNKGLAAVLERQWPGLARQRCIVHKLWNLQSHVPQGLREEVAVDFRAIVYAEDQRAACVAYEAFRRKWRRLHEGVARSLEEAGEDLLTFMRFPKAQWKALRTTNIIERLNGAFKQRIKTQGLFPSESSVLIVMFGVVASGMIRLRRIEGFETLGQAPEKAIETIAVA
jgi:transposase-like protein